MSNVVNEKFYNRIVQQSTSPFTEKICRYMFTNIKKLTRIQNINHNENESFKRKASQYTRRLHIPKLVLHIKA